MWKKGRADDKMTLPGALWCECGGEGGEGGVYFISHAAVGGQGFCGGEAAGEGWRVVEGEVEVAGCREDGAAGGSVVTDGDDEVPVQGRQFVYGFGEVGCHVAAGLCHDGEHVGIEPVFFHAGGMDLAGGGQELAGPGFCHLAAAGVAGTKDEKVHGGAGGEGLCLRGVVPVVLSVVNHLASHAAVYADVFAGDEASFCGAEVENHVGDVLRGADAAGGVLCGVGSVPGGGTGFYPAGGDGVHAHTAGEGDSEGMCEGGDASFRGGVALGAGHAHAVATGGYVHDGSPGGKVVLQQAGEHVGSCHTDLQGVVELLPAAVRQALEERGCVVDEVVHMPVALQDPGAEAAQVFLPGQITDKAGVLPEVKNAHMRSGLFELLCDAATDSLCSTRDDDYFSGEFAHAVIIAQRAGIVNRGAWRLRMV